MQSSIILDGGARCSDRRLKTGRLQRRPVMWGLLALAALIFPISREANGQEGAPRQPQQRVLKKSPRRHVETPQSRCLAFAGRSSTLAK